jgi:hypothetical protein
MKKYLGLWIVVLLVLCAASAWAYPTFNGVSGLVTLPTAEVTPTGAVDLAADYTKIDWWGNETKLYPVRLNAGVADNLELFASYDPADDEYNDVKSLWNVGAKYAFLTEANDDIGLALAGAWGKIDTDFDTVTIINAALALTKSFPVDENLKLKATAGVIYSNADSDDWIEGDTTRPYVGLELVGAKGANLGLEYRWKDSGIDAKDIFSAVVRLPLMPEAENSPLWLEVGTTNGSIVGFEDQKFFGGLCYRFMAD